MFTEDLDAFFNDEELAVEVTKDDTNTFNAIHDGKATLKDLNSGEIIRANPKLVAKASDVVGLSQGDMLTVEDTQYYIRGILPDGTGVVEIELTEDHG